MRGTIVAAHDFVVIATIRGFAHKVIAEVVYGTRRCCIRGNVIQGVATNADRRENAPKALEDVAMSRKIFWKIRMMKRLTADLRNRYAYFLEFSKARYLARSA